MERTATRTTAEIDRPEQTICHVVAARGFQGLRIKNSGIDDTGTSFSLVRAVWVQATACRDGDIDARAGTCYKASGWTPLGETKGYSRHQADFYIPNDRPKKLWVRKLCPDPTTKLCAEQLPTECIEGSQSDGAGVMPLKAKQIESLHDVFRRFKDPRARNSIYSIGSLRFFSAC